MKIQKTDYRDCDDPTTTIIEAVSIAAQVQEDLAELAEELEGDLTPTSGETTGDIQWEPGDGGQYTVAEYEAV